MIKKKITCRVNWNVNHSSEELCEIPNEKKKSDYESKTLSSNIATAKETMVLIS